MPLARSSICQVWLCINYSDDLRQENCWLLCSTAAIRPPFCLSIPSAPSHSDQPYVCLPLSSHLFYHCDLHGWFLAPAALPVILCSTFISSTWSVSSCPASHHPTCTRHLLDRLSEVGSQACGCRPGELGRAGRWRWRVRGAASSQAVHPFAPMSSLAPPCPRPYSSPCISLCPFFRSGRWQTTLSRWSGSLCQGGRTTAGLSVKHRMMKSQVHTLLSVHSASAFRQQPCYSHLLSLSLSLSLSLIPTMAEIWVLLVNSTSYH